MNGAVLRYRRLRSDKGKSINIECENCFFVARGGSVEDKRAAALSHALETGHALHGHGLRIG